MTEHICRECRDRIANGAAKLYLKHFDTLAASASDSGAATAALTLSFWCNKDELDGEYVAELLLRVQRADLLPEAKP